MTQCLGHQKLEGQDSPQSLQKGTACQRLDFRVPASRTMMEHISVVLSYLP